MKRLFFFFFSAHLAYCQINPLDVEIVRDKFGIPHIFGKTDADVAYGLAWANAEDDFETIQTDFEATRNDFETLQNDFGTLQNTCDAPPPPK